MSPLVILLSIGEHFGATLGLPLAGCAGIELFRLGAT